MVEMKQAKANYEIRGVTVRKDSNGYLLRWSYQKGNGFLIIVSSGREDRELGKDMISDIRDRWPEFMETLEYRFRGFKAFYVRESIFASQEKQFVLKKSDVEAFLPAKIQVFSCEQEGETVCVYKGREQENVLYIPLSIIVRTAYQKIWFSSKKRCIFQISPVKDYQDGMLLYHVGSPSPEFPLTGQCMGKAMMVILQRNTFLGWTIAEKYKRLYEVEEIEC